MQLQSSKDACIKKNDSLLHKAAFMCKNSGCVEQLQISFSFVHFLTTRRVLCTSMTNEGCMLALSLHVISSFILL